MMVYENCKFNSAQFQSMPDRRTDRTGKILRAVKIYS